jgi:beta-lactamase superfamily II metal-dependent hydrolase
MSNNEKVRVRAYQVYFGDCFLVTVPDGPVKRHILVDFGNVVGKGGDNAPFKAIARNIQEETKGHIDVVVMTHEHIDHMEGYYHQRKVFDKMTIDRVWMSYPSMPGYYEKYPQAELHKKLRILADHFSQQVRPRGLSLAPSFEALLRNNLSNSDRIDYIRKLPVNKNCVHYLARGHTLKNKPFKHVKGFVLAPEKSMSVYYDSLGHGFARMVSALDTSLSLDRTNQWNFPTVPRVERPYNLSEAAWRRLRESIQTGAIEVLRSIDKALNNTSLVFFLEVNDKRLLFTGDAELASWSIMAKKNKKHLKPFDFFKISHHGSHNGTPLELLDKILPRNRKKSTQVLVSTKEKVYGTKNPIPDQSLLAELAKRCVKLYRTDKTDKPWIDINV